MVGIGGGSCEVAWLVGDSCVVASTGLLLHNLTLCNCKEMDVAGPKFFQG